MIQSIDLQGTWTFDTTLTRSSANVGGNSAASFMLGYPTTAARIRTPFKPQMHTNEPSVFVQDDWRATSWLTVNLGVRYDVFTPFSEEANNLSNLDLTGPVPVVLVAGENGVSRYAGIKTDYTNLAPRLGFAATLPHAIVLRGGYGLSFFPANTGASYYLKNPPVIDSYGPVTSAGNSGGVPTVFFDGLPPLATQRPSTDPTQLSGAFRAVALDFKSTRMQQFNLQVEKELGANNVVTIGYVGSRGSRITGLPNMALAPPGPGAIQPRRRTYSVLPNVSSITVGSSIYKNRYDALQLVFQRRLHQGLSVNTHFRLAHGSLDTFAPWDPTVIEHLDAAQDARRAWVFQANYELPWARSATGWVGGLRRRMATQCRGQLADWRPVWRHQLDGAGKYRRHRPAQFRWRSGVAEERADAPAMVQHGGLPGAAGLYRGQLAADCAARSVATSLGPGVVQGSEAARLVHAAIAL